MRTRLGKEPVIFGGDETPRSNRTDSVDGGGISNGSISETALFSFGTGRAGREGEDSVSEKTWFDPVSTASPDVLSFGECKDGVCPVPWASKQNPVFTFENTPFTDGDDVNHPSHYTDGAIECIEAIEAQLTPDEYRGYLKGNIAKYIWRERHKGGVQSLKKAQWYMDRLIQFEELQNG